MKKIFAIVAIAILASVACSKEQMMEQIDPAQINPQTQTDAPADGFAWYVFQAGAATRTTVSGEKVLWSEGDRIKVIYGEGSGDFALSEEAVLDADASRASFKVALPATLSDDATVYAVYPSATEASVAGGGINVVIPNEQNAAFESADIVAAASKVSSRSFSFKQVCGLISFEISEENPKAVSKAHFKDLFETEVAGTLALTFDAAGAVSFGSVSDGHASIDLSGAAIELVDAENREYYLKKALDPIRDRYDYILIDCPPSLGILTLNGLAAADAVLVPMQCEYFALEGITLLLQTVKRVQQGINPSLKIGGIFFTMYDSRTRLAQDVVMQVKSYFEDLVFNTIIPRNIRLSEAPSYGKPICLYDPNCVGAKSYEKLSEEVLNRG